MIMKILFEQLPVGARFEFRGHRYQKLATSMACDENRWGNVFQAGTEVVCERALTPTAMPQRPCNSKTSQST